MLVVYAFRSCLTISTEMAIPLGKTSRQLEAMARWMLASVIIFGVFTWWWPGYRSWGALSAGLLIVFALWLLERIVSSERLIPGHPIHLVLLGPAAILVVHVVSSGIETDDKGLLGFGGAFDITMLYQFALVSLGVMLTQSLMPRAAKHAAVLSLCGAAMMGGAAMALASQKTADISSSLSLIGFGGVGVWLSPLWGMAPTETDHGERKIPRRLDVPRVACICVGAIAAVLLTIEAPRQATLAGGALAATLIVSGIVFHQRRIPLLITGGLLAVATVCARLHAIPSLPAFSASAEGFFGYGEAGFVHESNHRNSLAMLVASIGWGGVAWLAGGVMTCVIFMMSHARKGHRGDQARAIVWTAATVTTSLSLLASGGLFLPVATLATAFMWGLLPSMLGRPQRKRPAIVFLGVLVGFVVLLGLTRSGGLVTWSVKAFGFGDKFLHGVNGFFLAMVFAWLLGARNIYLGLIGIVLAVAAGGAGEWLQGIASTRAVESKDWQAHAIGCAIAVLPYLLCIGSRWAESADAVENNKKLSGYDVIP